MQIGIKAARVAAGMTQEEAAKKLGVTTASLSHWERGRREPKTTTFLRMCELYGVNPSDILMPKK